MKKLFSLAVAAVLITSAASASVILPQKKLVLNSSRGGETGNGGLGKFCKTADGKTIKSLDLYEAEFQELKLVDATNKSVSEIVSDALAKLALADAGLADEVKIWIAYFNANKTTVKASKNTTDDAQFSLDMPGCKDVQIVNWLDSDEVLIYGDRYEMLSNLDKAAIELHEGIYRVFRGRCSEDDSYGTRMLVRRLLSVDKYSNEDIQDLIRVNCGR